MTRTAVVVLLTVAIHAAEGAQMYQVWNTDDSGQGSLRAGIEWVNSHGNGNTIGFADWLKNETIKPATALPPITQPDTEIIGFFAGNDMPNITIDGSNLAGLDAGLQIQAPFCILRGLCFINCPTGLYVNAAKGVVVWTCHFGVDRLGTTKHANGYDARVWLCSQAIIGGTLPGERNVFSCGSTAASSGIELRNSSETAITGNYFGLTRDGSAALGGGGCGITIADDLGSSAANNRIGGTSSGERNIFAGLDTGVSLAPASSNTILGNWFGLAHDGATVLGMAHTCVAVDNGVGNVIGGTVPGARNVFVGSGGPDDAGVAFTGSDCHDNRVQGNYFGLDPTGASQRPLLLGVWAHYGVGRQTIGGNSAGARNYFAPNGSGSDEGVQLDGGANSSVLNDWFGLLPNGHAAPGMGNGYAIRVDVPGATVESNLIANAGDGILVSGSAANPGIYRNTIRACAKAVEITNLGHCLLGNLGNTKTNDDGNNSFAASNAWFIRNQTPNGIKAEGNSFGGLTTRDAINAKIYDKRDDPSLGPVDFDPLKGGVHPTGDGGAVVLTGAVAVPTGTGAEIAFNLSAPAAVTVEVLNLAGRPVATATRERTVEAGTNRLLWSGLTAQGTRAPAGSYLVRVMARGNDGGEARALCRVRLDR